MSRPQILVLVLAIVGTLILSFISGMTMCG